MSSATTPTGAWHQLVASPDARHAGIPTGSIAPAAILSDTARHSPKLRHFLHMSSLVSVLVVMLHAGGQPTDSEGPKWLLHAINWFNGAISLLRMPLFFFIAGFLFMHTNPPGQAFHYGRFLWKKVVRLLVPYVCLSTLAFPVKAWLSDHAMRHISFTWHDYLFSILDPSRNSIGFYWFLLALFIIFLAAPALRLMLIENGLGAIAMVTACTLLVRWYGSDLIPAFPNRIPVMFALHPAAYNFFYVWMGMVAWKYRQVWTTSLHPSLATLGMMLVTAYYLAFQQHPGFVRFVVVLLGFYSVYCLIDIYIKRGWTFLRLIDGKTYQIYLLAWFPQQFVVVVLYKMLHWNYWMCSLLMFGSGLVFPLVTRYVIETHLPVMAFVLGFAPAKAKVAGGKVPPPRLLAVTAPS